MSAKAIVSVLLLLAVASPVAARFETETVCNGFLKFPNDDGTSSEYELLIVLDSYGYALTSTDQETDEITVDIGECTDYAERGCTHEIEVEGEKTGDSYRFRIQKMSDTTFAYEEVWADGSVGRTILSCAAGTE
ncbi:MAG: hypothetical protein AB3N11_10220 [Arenibacterium sp.]